VLREFSDAQQVFRSELGISPVVMRVPNGLHWFGTEAAAKRLGMTDILWTVIGHDWEWSAEQVVEHVLEGMSPGAIVCLHDGREVRPLPDIAATVKAVREITRRLVDQGYGFERVSELLQA
jgi:peptidoglycan/xylan/chitin deacetylase (PgdA/CDA1 family)